MALPIMDLLKFLCVRVVGKFFYLAKPSNVAEQNDSSFLLSKHCLFAFPIARAPLDLLQLCSYVKGENFSAPLPLAEEIVRDGGAVNTQTLFVE